VVTAPNGYLGSVQLTYQLPDPKYVLLGLAFKGPNGGVGRLEFRGVAINRDVYREPTHRHRRVHECVRWHRVYLRDLGPRGREW